MLVTAWMLSTPSMYWRQFEGDSKPMIDSNALFRVLAAPDVVRIVLSPADADVPTRGLAWWSPSRGLWFAVDAAGTAAIGHTVELSLGIPGRKPMSPGAVYIQPEGSGRMLAVGDLASLMPHRGVITLGVTTDHTRLTGHVEAETLKR